MTAMRAGSSGGGGWRVLALVVSVCLARCLGAEPKPSRFRLGVSDASFGSVNRNDASAAIKAWAATVLKERGILVEARIELFAKAGDLREALAQAQVDAVGMSAAEFLAAPPPVESVFVARRRQATTEGYVLLTHRQAGISGLAGLRGRRLVLHENPRTQYVWPWLETELAEQRLGPAREFFGETTAMENPGKTVLRVFFRQTDACVVTTNAFELACELNPQVRQQLRVIASSPPLVPTLMFFRPGLAGTVLEQVEFAVRDLHTSVAGQQLLMVFQGDQMVQLPVSCLDSTRALLGRHGRLVAADGASLHPQCSGMIVPATAP